MTTTTIKLSAAQKDVLKTAIQYSGRVRRASVITLGILKDADLIVTGHRMAEPKERDETAFQRDELIRKAGEALSDLHWRKALNALRLAEDCQHQLDATCYWITELGRAQLKC